MEKKLKLLVLGCAIMLIASGKLSATEGGGESACPVGLTKKKGWIEVTNSRNFVYHCDNTGSGTCCA